MALQRHDKACSEQCPPRSFSQGLKQVKTKSFASPGRRLRGRPEGFTLAEVALAAALVAFTFLSLFGLVPVGLNTFRASIDTSVTSQIAQRVINDAQQTDFTALVGAATTPFFQALRYFDDQATEKPSATGAIYQVNVRVTPQTPLPQGATASSNVNLATVAVQVANNPANLCTAANPPNALWNDTSTMRIYTYNTCVARGL